VCIRPDFRRKVGGRYRCAYWGHEYEVLKGAVGAVP